MLLELRAVSAMVADGLGVRGENWGRGGERGGGGTCLHACNAAILLAIQEDTLHSK